MLPQMSDAYNLTAVAMASMVGVFYYGYSAFSLVAGTVIDRFGARAVLPAGALLTGFGSLLFATGDLTVCHRGSSASGRRRRVCAWSAPFTSPATTFRLRVAATLTGAAQMFGMAGGSAGQIACRADDRERLAVGGFLGRDGATGVLIAAALFFLLPGRNPGKTSIRETGSVYGTVHRIEESSDHSVWSHCRTPVHSNHDLRHDLGRSFLAGGARIRLWRCGYAFVDWSRLDGLSVVLCWVCFPTG